MDLDTESRNVLLLELSGQMALDEGGLPGDDVSFALVAGWLARCLSCSEASCAARSFLNTMCQIWTHLSCSAVADKHELEGGNGAACFSHGCELLWWGMCVM